MSEKIDNKSRIMFFKFLILGALVLTLQIPILKISELLSDRTLRRSVAVSEISRMAGGNQIIAGPLLKQLITTKNQIGIKPETGEPIYQTRQSNLFLVPKNLQVTSEVIVEPRTRGIFDVMTYTSKIVLNGTFEIPKPEISEEQGIVNIENSASLEFGVKDARFIREVSEAVWDEQAIQLKPGATSKFFENGVNASVPIDQSKKEISFKVAFTVSGSGAIRFLPFGRTWSVAMKSNSIEPSFIGEILPTSRKITPSGFNSEWNMSSLGHEIPEGYFETNTQMLNKLQFELIGAHFMNGVDAHRMTERSLKYQILFVLFTFGVFLVCEVLYRFKIHPVQYLMIGCALTLFYLLLLSLSDHINFLLSYIIAAGLAIMLIGGYSKTVLKEGKRARFMSGLLAALYAFLYMLLLEQDYALLFGSLGLTIGLGLVMYLTRNIDWYKLDTGKEQIS